MLLLSFILVRDGSSSPPCQRVQVLARWTHHLFSPVPAPLTSDSRRYTLCITVRFEWDSAKNRINQRKHDGIAFETAALVFDDPLAIFRKDRTVAGEQRWHVIGAVEGAVLLVVHVYRLEDENGEEEAIRIISAREANKRERRIYVQQAAE